MLQYERIGRSSLYDDVADQIEKMILQDYLKVGDKLPSEQTLADNFGVSRNILREALKTLKERGLIEVKSGHGAFVIKPKSKTLGDVVNRLVLLSDVTMNDVYEIRYALEVEACGLAAERAEKADIDELAEIINVMKANVDNLEKWVEAELKFHTTIAKASKNTLFISFIKPVANYLIDVFVEGYDKPGGNNEGLSGHKLILDAIKSGDKKTAKKAMRTHLEHSRNLVLENKRPLGK